MRFWLWSCSLAASYPQGRTHRHLHYNSNGFLQCRNEGKMKMSGILLLVKQQAKQHHSCLLQLAVAKMSQCCPLAWWYLPQQNQYHYLQSWAKYASSLVCAPIKIKYQHMTQNQWILQPVLMKVEKSLSCWSPSTNLIQLDSVSSPNNERVICELM